MTTFKISYKDKKTKARIGILQTKKGPIQTPFFMPVSTKAAAKYINSKQLEELKASATISNALILSIRPGDKLIKKLGGIKKFMNFSGINVTDSGGFQMYSDSIYVKSTEKGVIFKNPFAGEKILMTPEKNMEIQLNIGAEIAMCLDSMPLYEDSKQSIKESARITTLWAKRCKIHHDKLQKNIPKNKRQLLFGITQGGVYKDLREKSIKELLKLDFDGYSIGGLGMGETKKEEDIIVKLKKKLIPENKPIYLMGIGSPIEILDAIAKGVDMFDSRMPTQSARRGTLFTSNGKLKILNKKYKTDKNPIDKKCNCFACKNYSRAYINHLLKNDEPVGMELASFHNLYFLQNLIKHAKEHIKKGDFKSFSDKMTSSYT